MRNTTFQNYENWRSTLKISNNHRNTYLTRPFHSLFSWGCGRTRFSALLLMVWPSTCLVMSPSLWFSALLLMVWPSTCLVMSSSLCIAPWFLKSISARVCTAKTLCWPAVITAKQIFVKKYRTMIIIISKSRFGSISIDRIITASSFWTFCSLRSKLNSDDHNTKQAFLC